MITLHDSIKIIQSIEPILNSIGYHCGLTGSILYQGYSEKDIDIIIYPHTSNKLLADTTILNELNKIGLVNKYNGSVPSCKDKIVYVCDINGIRVDLFFL